MLMPLFAVLASTMGVMGGAVLSPDPRMNPAMNGGGKQSKAGTRSSSHGGSQKKKSSPIPANHCGGGSANKDHFVLVAAEAMPLSTAGNDSLRLVCLCEKVTSSLGKIHI